MDNVSELMKYSTPEIKSIAPVAEETCLSRRLAKAYGGEATFKRTFKFVFEDTEFCVEDVEIKDNPILKMADGTYGILHLGKLHNLDQLLSLQVKSGGMEWEVWNSLDETLRGNL